ncbi:MAG: phosphoribosylglycinamide formyltransferase [bacterium]|nr:phosphoribosylglycinamide formyltransferase [bacterium]
MGAKRTVVLASGRGSNFQAVLQGIREGSVRDCAIVGLVTDRPNTGAEELARDFNAAAGKQGAADAFAKIEIHSFDFKSFPNRDTYDRLLLDTLKKLNPDLILTLGYMRLLAPQLVQNFAGRIINIHPSLLPAFPGMHSARQAYEYGVKIAGATVHFVDEGVDTGAIIDQAAVDVPDDVDAVGLADLILVQEHRILTRAVDSFCQDRLRLDQNKRKVSTLS